MCTKSFILIIPQRGNKTDLAGVVSLYKRLDLNVTTQYTTDRLLGELQNMTSLGQLFSRENISSIGYFGKSALCNPDLFSVEPQVQAKLHPLLSVCHSTSRPSLNTIGNSIQWDHTRYTILQEGTPVILVHTTPKTLSPDAGLQDRLHRWELPLCPNHHLLLHHDPAGAVCKPRTSCATHVRR